jgi:N-acetyl-anhydromuramyl-L-alanine amidase AmpD
MHRLALPAVVVAAACTPAPAPAGPVAQSIARAADAAAVPRDLMVAIAVAEGGLMLPALRLPDPEDHVPVAGVLELRHGAFNSLARGAALVGRDELALRADTDLGTRAGALVLAELGRQANVSNRSDLAAWRPALAILSGMRDAAGRARYAEDVLAILRAGGRFPARGGERVALAAHPEIAPAPSLIVTAAGTPEFPGAIWYDTSCNNKCDTTRTAGTSVVDMIVIHDTEGGWNASVATLQNDAGKSVHYIVDADGSRVGQFVPESYTAWHAGNYYYNQRSVGIEHVGMAADPNGYSDGLYAKSTALVQSIRTRWKVPVDRTHIIGHYQIPDGNTMPESSPSCSDTLANCESSPDYGGADNHRDPGFYWMWCTYMAGLGGSCDCNDAYSLWNCTTDHKAAVRCVKGKVEIESCDQGCVSKPDGVDDVCQMSMSSGSDGGTSGGSSSDGGSSGGGSSDGGTSDSGSGDATGSGDGGPRGGQPTAGHGHASGCAVAGNGGGGVWLVLITLAIAGARSLRRRRAALS